MSEVVQDRHSRALLKIAAAVGIVAAAFLLRRTLVSSLGITLPPYITFFPAVIVAAELFGFRYGLLATALASVVIDCFLLKPIGSFAIASRSDAVGLALFIIIGIFTSVVAERSRRNQTRIRVLEREQERSAGEAQFRILADCIPQLCWYANADGWLEWYNQRWYEYTGTTPEQMEGWGWQSVHDPKLLPEVMERWKSSITTGEPFDMVLPLRGADGIFRPFLTRVMPVRDGAGRVVRWFGTNTDISEQKRTEAELRNSQERLALALDVARLGEWELDLLRDTGYRSDRHKQIFGYPPEAGNSDWNFGKLISHILPEHRDKVAQTLEGMRSSGGWEYETQIRRMDGEVRWIWARGRCVMDENGTQTRAFGVVGDITERKLSEQALLRSEKLASVGRLAASIAHEINNPLEALGNLIFLARNAEQLPSAAHHFLELADTELKRIAHITRQSLGFYRECNSPENTDVGAVLESAIDLLRGRIRKKRAIIERRVEAGVTLMAVAGELRQVFANLLANSLDAIREGGKIQLRVSTGAASASGPRCVRVAFADNGCGIPVSARQHLFEPFYTTKGSIGTGLGLWVSKQIVEKHEGTITVRSACGASRHGTVFYITLPIKQAASAVSGTD